jgi:hypothetical protein
VKQTDAIRAALLELGLDAPKETLKEWVMAKGVNPTDSFASQVSQQKKRLRERGESDQPSSPKTRTLDVVALIELRKLVGADPKAFKQVVAKVERAVEMVGGFDQLCAFLDSEIGKPE